MQRQVPRHVGARLQPGQHVISSEFTSPLKCLASRTRSFISPLPLPGRIVAELQTQVLQRLLAPVPHRWPFSVYLYSMAARKEVFAVSPRGRTACASMLWFLPFEQVRTHARTFLFAFHVTVQRRVALYPQTDLVPFPGA